MYPIVEIYWYTLYLHWLWIVLATCVFLFWIYRYSKKFNLRFPYFFSFLSFFIIVPYFLWRYFYDLIEYKFYFPVDIFQLLSPYNYRFSFIWVSGWLLFMVFIFLLSLQYIQERKKWFDIFFLSITLSMVVIWPFLLLWDIFYWNVTNSIFWITPLTANTQIPYTKPIWPVGIFVSILWLALHIFAKILLAFLKKPWITLYLLPFLFLWFAYIFTFQHYPKHFLFWIDVKIFYSVFAAFFATIVFYFVLRKKEN